MAHPLTRAQAEETLAAIAAAIAAGAAPPGTNARPGQISAIAAAAQQLAVGRTAMHGRLAAIARNHPDLTLTLPAPAPATVTAPQGKSSSPLTPPPTLADKVRARLMKGEASRAELEALTGLGPSAVEGLLQDLAAAGANLAAVGESFAIAKSPPLPSPISAAGEMPVLMSRPDNTFLIGACGDTHLGSKYERLDVLNDLYDRFARASVQAVYHTGNWIEGEARFNKFDLAVHGMEAQCRYLAKNYPARPGLTTFAVAGDDHEGWYGQREGVDIGRFAEAIMRREGREDWVNLGFMEAYVRLVNCNSGASSVMAVVHPGGGSAYALSYSIQKIIEALDGGEKPAVGLYGHYHKLWAGNIRNVWCLQTGTTKDQDPFMRKKKIDAHVGGAIVGMEQDPATGAIIGFTPQMIRYFNKGYYANRWSQAGAVDLAERGP